MRRQDIRNNKGITLIALIVTIVVILILAGVSISMLTGEDGIIK
ncbi:MAG: prepilin-type N-terminal cleavage/methylation domain-containing protein, partial [Tidjanibacter sp.]|nr:prepilin-type N-terminal cleavage/methylation domain-containing protein [Tidjanibacter sp.]